MDTGNMKISSPLLVVACLLSPLFAASTTWGQCESAKLLASDGAATDFFGFSVAISGTTAIVGAWWDDDNGDGSGSSYVYRFNGTTWVEEAKLLASDGATGDHFGWSVAVSGDVAIVGARDDDDNGSDSGSAYIFQFNGSTWIQQAKLLASDGAATDFFGASVGISGDFAIVGAWMDDDNGNNSGSVYVFRFNGSSWAEEVKLLSSDGAAGDSFGFSVAISDDVLIVGADGNDDNGMESGSSYVYRFNGTTWVEEAKLLASDGRDNDFHFLGESVAICGDVAVAGAWQSDDNGPGSGSAYLYRYDGSTWTEEVKLLASDATAGDFFGTSVAVDGDTVIVGAGWHNGSGDNSGLAYVFRFDGTIWIEDAKLLRSDGAAGDLFGEAVALSGDLAIVGARHDDDNGMESGSAYIFALPLKDCDNNGLADSCEIALGMSEDCDGNEIPDACQILYFVDASPPMSPLGDGIPHTYIISTPPEAGMGVLISLVARGDLGAPAETIDVFLNGQLIGTVFKQDGNDCPVPPDEGQLTLDVEMFNALVDGGDAEFQLVASFAVDPKLCAGSFIAIQVAYQAITEDDCNGNGVPDICDIINGDLIDDNGNWMPDECESPADLTGPFGVPDGCVDAFDLGAMLGAWCSAVKDPNPPSPPCENCTPANLAIADISGAANVPDGCVDAFDLGALLGAWCSVAGGNPCGTCQ